MKRSVPRLWPPPRSWRRLAVAVGCAGLGCAAAPAQTPGPASPAEPSPAELASAEPAPLPDREEGREPEAGGAPGESDDDGLDADIAALSASTAAGAAAARATETERPGEAAAGAGAETDGRQIVYRVTPRGLVIEIDGIHLRPVAKPFKDKGGAYGVELTLEAESFDGRQYWLKTPSEGPLALAGKIEKKDGASSRFADERAGDGERVVMGGAPERFRQRWPGNGQPKLRSGQTVTLEVGLWGLRVESGRERPVRRLFVVKMVAGNRAQAVITPPTLDWGS